MEATHAPGTRGQGLAFGSSAPQPNRRPVSRNKQWFAEGGISKGHGTASEGERWVRGRPRGGGRGGRAGGRGSMNRTLRAWPHIPSKDEHSHVGEQDVMDEPDVEEIDEQDIVDEPEVEEIDEQDPDTPEEREKFYQELVKAREIERKKAIAEGKMDDPQVPKRLEDAITMVGTCTDMCPRFERYRRERENNLFEWETKPGTKRVDHKRAVKMYERAAGDKTLPSDLRPPMVLKRTLDYLFHDLIPRGGFSQTFNFIRDRSRAVRNDFTMQHETGALAMNCHDRCVRFHILALHFERDRPGFSIALEEQQLMNTLQSLKEFYEDQRSRYQSPTELEMRVYHRLIHIRDQRERQDDVPAHVLEHPVFKLTTKFRLHVQAKSAPIGKTTPLIVDYEGMQIFSELAMVLRREGSVVMIYLVACLLERLFGKETIEDIESIRGDLTIPELIDGIPDDSQLVVTPEMPEATLGNGPLEGDDSRMFEEGGARAVAPIPLKPSATAWLSDTFGQKPTTSAIFGQPPTHASAPSVETTVNPSPFFPTQAPQPPPPLKSAFSSLSSTPNPFGSAVFGGPAASITASTPPKSAFGNLASEQASTPAPVASASDPLPTSKSDLHFSAFNTSPFGEAPTRPTISSSASAPSISANPNPFFAAPIVASSTSNAFPTTTTTSTSANPFANIPTKFPTFPSSTPPTLNPAAPSFTPLPKPQNEPVASTANAGPAPPQFTNRPTPLGDQKPFSVTASNYFASPTIDSNTSTFVEPTPQESPQSKPKNRLKSSGSVGHHPTLFKINTTNITPPSSSGTVPSPSSQPPPLKRQRIISLPSTPTSPFKATPSKSWLDSIKGQPSASNSQELLSPLYLSSPARSPPLSPKVNGTSVPLADASPESSKPSPIKPKSGALSNSKKDALAEVFIRKSLLVKECFDRWQQRTTDRALWLEACQHSDAYQQKVKRQGPRHPSEKKRVISTTPTETTYKRAKRRVSGKYQPPLTDEELAHRFKENHKEHERRWVKGSFLEVVKTHVMSEYGSVSPDWRLWLSMNPENDGTAIWMEHKFDVPASGQWESESIFSIPLRQRKAASSPSPGLIVFESTPLERVSDELERKFHVLDDCARLRDIIKSLPAKHPFVPSLLVFYWGDGDQNKLPSDLSDMITKLVDESVLESSHAFFISSVTEDLDQKFGESLKSLTLDVEGRLVQSLALKGVFKLFQSTWAPFYLEWLENCSSNGQFDWVLYARLIETTVDALNEMTHSVLKLIDADTEFDPLPSSDFHEISDSVSAFGTIMSWLADENAIGEDAAAILRDLVSHQAIGREFPSRTFLDHLHDLAEYRTQLHLANDKRYNILKTEITPAVEQFDLILQPLTLKMQRALAMRMRRSPKRRFGSEETDLSSSSKRLKFTSAFDSGASSDVSNAASPEANGRSSPTPSTSTVNGSSEIITIGMLRALTKDVKERFGASR